VTGVQTCALPIFEEIVVVLGWRFFPPLPIPLSRGERGLDCAAVMVCAHTRIPALGRDFCWCGVGLAYPDPCVAEHAHPGAVFAPVVRVPGVLDCAEDAFRVRHHDGDAAVAAGEAGDAAGGAVGVGRVAVGHASVVVDEAQGYAAAGFAGVHGGAVGKLGITFAVGDGDRHARADHAAEEDRRRGLDLDHGDPGFE